MTILKQFKNGDTLLMIFRKTTYADIPTVLTIIKQAQHYLKSQQIDQWQNGYPNEPSLAADIDHGYSYVMEENGTIVGTLALIFDPEPTYTHIYEGTWKTTDTCYATLHRVAVADEWKGMGIAGKMLAKVEQICHTHSVSSIRMDTHRENLSMQRMMQKNGFVYCGVIYLEDGAKRLAFEKMLS